MREFIDQNGQPAGWHVMSALEARIIGRAGVMGHPDEVTTFYLHHNGTEGVASSEAEFAEREARYGRLIVGRSIANRAEQALRQIATSGQAWNGINPNVAQAFVTLLDAGLQESRVLVVPEAPEETKKPMAAVPEIPEIPGPVNAEDTVKRAA